jgi:MFS family permease
VIRLCVAGFIAYCSYAICRTPLLPLFARDLGASPAQIGLVVAASTVTGALLKLPAGVWSDLLGRRPLLLTAAAVFALVPFAYLAVAGLTALVAIRLMHGSATAIMGPVMSATISDLAPIGRRATWLSTYATVQGSGQALAPVVAGAMIARGRYDLAFLLAGVIGLGTPFRFFAGPFPRK